MSTIELDSKVKELRELRRMAEELQSEIDSLQDTIKAEMTAREVDTIAGSDYRITWKTVTTSRLDTTGLKKALPDVAERFISCRYGNLGQDLNFREGFCSRVNMLYPNDILKRPRSLCHTSYFLYFEIL